MHYYQFHIGDYTSETAYLEPMEDLAYRRMLDLYYSKEKPLPIDLNNLSKLIRMRTHNECIANVLRDFFTKEKDGWHNERADIEIFKFNEKSVKATASAKARWKKTKEKQKADDASEGNANGMRTHSEGNANHKPRTTNQEPSTKNQEPLAPAVSWTPPPLLNMQAWAEFEEHRKTAKGKFSDLARTKAANSIIHLSSQEQQATIDRSIQAGWAGLFPDKNKSKVSQIEASHKSLKEELFGNDDSETIDGECHEQY